MDRLESSYPPESTLQASSEVTEATIQASAREFFGKKEEKMAYEVEYTDEFEQWWLTLDEATQIRIRAIVKMLKIKGPNLRHYSSGINGSRHSRMRELRVQHKGNPYRILYVFDPRRVAVLLLGGSKIGNKRWYKEKVPKADRLYDEWLKSQQMKV